MKQGREIGRRSEKEGNQRNRRPRKGNERRK